MNKRILVVDDSHSIVKMLEVVLKKEGFTVFTAFNGKEGLALARSEKPDLIILDIIMPEMDGYEVCQALQKDRATASIPVIFLTIKGQMGKLGDQSMGPGFYAAKISEQEKAFSVGAVDFITKPVIAKELLRRVKAMLWIGTSDAKE